MKLKKKINSITKEREDSLRKLAERNTQVTKGTKDNQRVIKEGIPLENSRKVGVNNSTSNNIVGMSKGITKNMGDYESLRVDCWLALSVEPSDDINEVFDTISEIIDERLEKEVESVLDDN